MPGPSSLRSLPPRPHRASTLSRVPGSSGGDPNTRLAGHTHNWEYHYHRAFRSSEGPFHSSSIFACPTFFIRIECLVPRQRLSMGSDIHIIEHSSSASPQTKIVQTLLAHT